MRSGGRVPHRDVISLRNHLLYRRLDVRERNANGFHEVCEAIRPAGFLRHRFMAVVDKAWRKYLGRYVQSSLVEHLFHDVAHELLVMLWACHDCGHWSSIHVFAPPINGVELHWKSQGSSLQYGQ